MNDTDFDIEQFYNHDNILIIDKNFRNKNHFAILIITNKLKAFYLQLNLEAESTSQLLRMMRLT